MELLPYLLNHFDFSAHNLIQGRSSAELVTLGDIVDFQVGGSIFWTKNYVFGTLPYPLNRLEFSAYILTQGRSWVELAPLGCPIHFWLGGSIFGAKIRF